MYQMYISNEHIVCRQINQMIDAQKKLNLL